MNTLVKVMVDMPYPKEFEFRPKAGSVPVAVKRALKELRENLKGRRIKHYKITVDVL